MNARAIHLALLLLLAASETFANPQYTMPRVRIAGGGATLTGGSYVLTSTAGQSDAGTLSGGTYSLSGGFWGGSPSLVGVDDPPAAELAFALHGAMPNPTTASTVLRFDLPRAANASMVIYDAAGRMVRTLVRGAVAAGQHRETWNGTDDSGRAVGAGVYFVRLEAEGLNARRRIVLLR